MTARDQETRESVGDMLRAYRRAAGLTQQTLGERAGYSTVYISMLERGQRVPLPRTADVLADALDLSRGERVAFQRACAPANKSHSERPLVGREREMALLQAHLAAGVRPLILIAGEPGIGKTRLLHETAEHARIMGMQVLWGGCARRGGQEPYAPLSDALAAFVRSQNKEQVERYLDGCGWIRRVLPELPDDVVEPLPGWRVTSGGERRLVIEALSRFLGAAGRTEGAMLVLDDLQWASADALSLLSGLVRLRTPLRVVAAYRDVEIHAGHPLGEFLAEMGESGLATHLALSPLQPSDAEALVNHLVGDDPDMRERVLSLAGGVPFYLMSYADEARSRVDGDGAGLPWDIVQSVRQRIEMLSESAQDLLEAAAIIGRDVPREVLGRVTGQPDTVLIEALETACRARLLAEAGGKRYLFTHDVVREVIEHRMSAARRAVLHLRVGDALEQQSSGAMVEALAYHFARSDDVTRTLRYLERAGDRARARHAVSTAEGYYREFVDTMDRLGRDVEAAAAREKLGAALLIGGRYEPALAVLEQAAEMYRVAGREADEGRVVASIGRMHYLRGTAGEGIRRLEPLAAAVRDSRAQAALQAALASLYLSMGRYGDQLAAAEAASHLARSLDDTALLAESEVWRGCALNQLGRVDEGRQVQQGAVALAEAVGDVVSLSHALNDIAFLSEIGGELEQSRRWKLRALALAERTGDPATVGNMAFRCGQNSFLSGDWQAARNSYERALAIAHDAGAAAILPYPLFGLALLAAAGERWDDAVALAQSSLTAADACRDEQAAQAAHSVLAENEIRTGNARAALDRLEPYAGQADGLELHPVLPVLASAALEAGELDRARAYAERALGVAEAKGNQVARLEALRVVALVTAETDPAAALDMIDEALQVARSMPYPWAEARLLAAAGHCGKHHTTLRPSVALTLAREHVSPVLEDRAPRSPAEMEAGTSDSAVTTSADGLARC